MRTEDVLELEPHLKKMSKPTIIYLTLQGASNNECFDLG